MEEDKTDIKPKKKNTTKLFCIFDGCDEYFFYKWRLDRHIRKHNGERPFICTNDDCEKAFTCRTYLAKHMKTHENLNKQIKIRKTYECPECKHIFKQKYNLKVHMYQHTGEKPFKCDLCTQSFTNASRLRSHIKKHNGYKCNRLNCDYVASKWTELQKHVANEHKEIFKCTECDKKFNAEYSLTKHFKIHNGERIQCTYDNCNRTYTTQSNLNAHLRIDHEGIRFNCDYCLKSFKYNKTLTKHINKQHKSLNNLNEQKSKTKSIYIKRVSYASKLTGIECCDNELNNILINDKNFRKEISCN